MQGKCLSPTQLFISLSGSKYQMPEEHNLQHLEWTKEEIRRRLWRNYQLDKIGLSKKAFTEKYWERKIHIWGKNWVKMQTLVIKVKEELFLIKGYILLHMFQVQLDTREEIKFIFNILLIFSYQFKLFTFF